MRLQPVIKSRRARAAFTLLEVMVSTAVLAMLISMSLVLLGSFSEIYSAGREFSRTHGAARIAVSVFARDLEQAILRGDLPANAYGLDAAKQPEDRSGCFFLTRRESLPDAGVTTNRDNPARAISRVGYHLADDGNLVRSSTGLAYNSSIFSAATLNTLVPVEYALTDDLFGGVTYNDGMPYTIGGEVWRQAPYTTARYREFVRSQITELLTQYGTIAEFWLDIPGILPRDFREELYAEMAALQPDMVIMANHGIGDGTSFDVSYAWPTDLIAIERALPIAGGHQPWRSIAGKNHYLPAEVCEPAGKDWFFTETDVPRSDADLLGMALICRSRGANLLLDIGPDRSGLVPPAFRDALARLGKNLAANQALLPVT